MASFLFAETPTKKERVPVPEEKEAVEVEMLNEEYCFVKTEQQCVLLWSFIYRWYVARVVRGIQTKRGQIADYSRFVSTRLSSFGCRRCMN